MSPLGLPPAHTSAAPPEPPRILTLDNIVIYGEDTGRVRWARGTLWRRVGGMSRKCLVLSHLNWDSKRVAPPSAALGLPVEVSVVVR